MTMGFLPKKYKGLRNTGIPGLTNPSWEEWGNPPPNNDLLPLYAPDNPFYNPSTPRASSVPVLNAPDTYLDVSGQMLNKPEKPPYVTDQMWNALYPAYQGPTAAESFERQQRLNQQQINQQAEANPELYYNMRMPSFLSPNQSNYYKGNFNQMYNDWLINKQKTTDLGLMNDPFGAGQPTFVPGGDPTPPSYQQPQTFLDYLGGYDWVGEYNKNHGMKNPYARW